jgi:hypothetical protein
MKPKHVEVLTTREINQIYTYMYRFYMGKMNSIKIPGFCLRIRVSYCFRFRRGFKQVFSCCPCVHLAPETLSRREVVTSRYSCSGSPEAQCRIIRNGKRLLVLTCPSSSPSKRGMVSLVQHILNSNKTKMLFVCQHYTLYVVEVYIFS